VERFVFIDESAALTNLVRVYGWSLCGERAPGTAPCGHWDRVTVLGALGPEGIVAAMSIPAATDGAVFHAYLDQVLLPELRRSKPNAVLIMDNLRAHKTQAVRALLDGSGFTYLYLPRYSPELVWGFACQALTIAAPPSSAACSRSMTGDDDRRGACLGARGVAPQPCIRSARGEAGP
jgi:hypothetical protein